MIAPGVALYTTSTLAAGAHNIGATYSGDAHHPAATSLAIVQTVMGSTPSFWFESSTGNEIGNGAAAGVTRPTTAMFTVGGTLSEATVTVREMWDSWTITLAPMTGHVLAPGYYSGASTNSDAKHPSLDISDDGYACNDVGGVFRIFSIATDSAGHVTELSADIERGLPEPRRTDLRRDRNGRLNGPRWALSGRVCNGRAVRPARARPGGAGSARPSPRR